MPRLNVSIGIFAGIIYAVARRRRHHRFGRYRVAFTNNERIYLREQKYARICKNAWPASQTTRRLHIFQQLTQLRLFAALRRLGGA